METNIANDNSTRDSLKMQMTTGGASNIGFVCESEIQESRIDIPTSINHDTSKTNNVSGSENKNNHKLQTHDKEAFSKIIDDDNLHEIKLTEEDLEGDVTGVKCQQNGGRNEIGHMPTDANVAIDIPTDSSVPRDTTLATDVHTDTTVATYRHKILETVFLFWNVTMLGFGYGQIGPAFPDLQRIGDVPLQEASWLFTGFAIGYLVGCLLAGIIRDKIDLRLMLCLYTLGVAITTGVLPWLPSFVVMVVIRVFTGLFIGGQDTVNHSLIFSIWTKDGGPYLQAVHCFFALGGITSPLVTKPFLSKRPDLESQTISSTLNGSYSNHSLVATTTLDNITTSLTTADFYTNVHYAFFITAMLMVSSAVPFLFFYFSRRGSVVNRPHQHNNEATSGKTPSPKVKYVVLCVLVTYSLIATAAIDMFPNFLNTFVIAQLGWTQQDGSEISSLYFGAYGFGNLIGIFVLKYCTSTNLIAVSYITSCITIVGVYVGVLYEQNVTIWVLVTVLGLAMSIILPTIFTWTQENVTQITTRVSSSLLISGSLGVMLDPLLLGFLMDQYEPIWFLYVSFTELTTCAALFVIAFVLSRRYLSHARSQNNQARQPPNVTTEHQHNGIAINNTFERVVEISHESRLHKNIIKIEKYPMSVRL